MIDIITEKTKNEQKFLKWQKSVESFLEIADKKEDRMLRIFALRYAARYYYCIGETPKAINLIQEALMNYPGSSIQQKIAETDLWRYLNTK